MYLPIWISKLISPEEVLQVEKQIADSEKITQAEIVPIVVQDSEVKYKEFKYSYIFCFLAAFVTVNPLFFGVIYLLYNLQKKMARAAVFQRAQKEFYASRVNQTKSRMGVMIMISLKERQAVVLADEQIAQFVSLTAWEEVVKVIQTEMKNKNLTAALVKAITVVAQTCHKIAPPVVNDENELINKLVIKE